MPRVFLLLKLSEADTWPTLGVLPISKEFTETHVSIFLILNLLVREKLITTNNFVKFVLILLFLCYLVWCDPYGSKDGKRASGKIEYRLRTFTIEKKKELYPKNY
jgi:hypothetical protein